MSCAVRHRGPDDDGAYLNPERDVALIHRRLSILDLSAAGRQPMCNEDGSIWMTYNGEIYNFQELRRELARKGHRFRSQSDGEILVHLYEEEGAGLVKRLAGMFAFAIYDQPRRRLLLARDHLGIKPLYYAEGPAGFLFASEIKGILASGLVNPEVNWQGILDYFTFLFVPHPGTAFQGIHALPPAHTLAYDLATGRLTTERYWTPWESPVRPAPADGELREQVRELLTQSVRSQLVSDVPLGLFFSGGIDSTLLAALMTRFSSERVKTFTVTFRGPDVGPCNDLPYARAASRALGTDHHELQVDLPDPEQWLEAIRLVDQPFGNPTLYLQHLIARATRKEVTVALSGVGGDELFGGYPKYRLLPWAPLLQRVPSPAGRLLRRILSLVREDTWVPVLRRAKRLLRGTGLPLPEQYLRWSYSLDEVEKRRLLRVLANSRFLPAVRIVEEAMASAPADSDRYARVFAAELRTFLADNLLEYTDKATMAVALETRVPFLDHRLVELSAKIPFRDKASPGQTKRILIDAFRDLLPAEIVQAPKRGFSPPLTPWVNDLLGRGFPEMFSKERTERVGVFCWNSIERLRRDHLQKKRDASQELLALLMFDAWHQRYLLS